MPDPRRVLQASFDPTKCFGTYGDALLQMHIKGFRTHKDTLLTIESPITAFCGVNGTGKSTVLQLAASAYQPDTGRRFYVSTFILAGSLDRKPFEDDASVEFTYADAPQSDGKVIPRKLSLSRSASSWAGYDRQPRRTVSYLGCGFFVPHAERDASLQAPFSDATYLRRARRNVEASVIEWVSKILLCKYDGAHINSLRKKYARQHTHAMTATREGGLEYSEANMGSGEARLYALITKLETVPERSLVLLEEPENALHPCAQYELGKYLVERAPQRKLQIMLTTHSEYILLALPQKSRIYLKRDGDKVVPIPGVGVRQAISLMDNLAIPAMYILVEDEVAEAIVVALLRKHDPDFLKTTRVLIAGDKDRIHKMSSVFADQKLPVCAVRDGDCGTDKDLKMYKLFGDSPPEKEMFSSTSFRAFFQTHHGVDWAAVDTINSAKPDHHKWFEALETQTAMKKPELLPVAAKAYLDGIPELERTSLVEQLKASTP